MCTLCGWRRTAPARPEPGGGRPDPAPAAGEGPDRPEPGGRPRGLLAGGLPNELIRCADGVGTDGVRPRCADGVESDGVRPRRSDAGGGEGEEEGDAEPRASARAPAGVAVGRRPVDAGVAGAGPCLVRDKFVPLRLSCLG